MMAESRPKTVEELIGKDLSALVLQCGNTGTNKSQDTNTTAMRTSLQYAVSDNFQRCGSGGSGRMCLLHGMVGVAARK